MKDQPDVCLEIENSLPLWVGGDLDPAAEAAVGEHLARCARCGGLAARARSARAALQSGLAAQARHLGSGPDVWPGIRAALQAEGRLGPAPAPVERERVALRPLRGPSRIGSWKTIVGIPIAAAVLAALFFFTRSNGSAGPTGSPSGSSLVDGAPTVAPGSNAPYVAQPVSSSLPVSSPLADSSLEEARSPGLRRHAPGEPRLRDTARDANPLQDGWPKDRNHLGSPVGYVERLQGVPPK